MLRSNTISVHNWVLIRVRQHTDLVDHVADGEEVRVACVGLIVFRGGRLPLASLQLHEADDECASVAAVVRRHDLDGELRVRRERADVVAAAAGVHVAPPLAVLQLAVPLELLVAVQTGHRSRRLLMLLERDAARAGPGTGAHIRALCAGERQRSGQKLGERVGAQMADF